jgi:hypothetical protein
MSENSFIDLVEIEDCLSESKGLQEEIQRKVSVLTDAIKILEDDSISIPESIYGLLDGYKAHLNLERELLTGYLKSAKIMKKNGKDKN